MKRFHADAVLDLSMPDINLLPILSSRRNWFDLVTMPQVLLLDRKAIGIVTPTYSFTFTHTTTEQTHQRFVKPNCLVDPTRRHSIAEIPYKVLVRANSRPSGAVHDSTNLHLVIVGEEGQTNQIRLRRNPKTGKIELEFKAADVGKVSDAEIDDFWIDRFWSNRFRRSSLAKTKMTTTWFGVLKVSSSDETRKWQRKIHFQEQHKANSNLCFSSILDSTWARPSNRTGAAKSSRPRCTENQV